MRTLRISLPYACGLLVLALAGCSTVTLPVTGVSAAKPNLWVGTWGASMTNAETNVDNHTSNDESFRFLVTPTIGGTEERVSFSNVYGTTPVTIGAAHLSVGQDGTSAVDATKDIKLAFSGQPGITIAPGQVVVSDSASMTFSFGQVLAVSVYLKGGFGPVSRHSSLFIRNYRTGAGSGDQTSDTAGSSYRSTLSDWLLVNRIDVYGPYQGTLALFGSSTTDGTHSDYSANQVYPMPNSPLSGQHAARLSDWLARRLNAAGYQIGVINEGIGGDTVTNDIADRINHLEYANQRIAQDVLSTPNLLGIVSYFGAIDLRTADCRSAADIEAATTQLIASAAAAKAPVILATLPPSAFCTNPAETNYGPYPMPGSPYAGGVSPGPANGAELQRMAFNSWIRQTGSSLPGVVGIADFDLALKDPSHPSFLLSAYNSGDNYHPNGAGYQAESEAIPLSLF